MPLYKKRIVRGVDDLCAGSKQETGEPGEIRPAWVWRRTRRLRRATFRGSERRVHARYYPVK